MIDRDGQPASPLRGREPTDEQIGSAILKFARDQGREVNLTYDKGSYEVTTPTWLAREFARVILTLASPPEDEDDWNIVKYIDFLRADEGDSVTLLCDNPEGPPNNAVTCNGYWTNWEDRRFEGETLLVALSIAYIECTQRRAALSASPPEQPAAATTNGDRT